VQLKPFFILGIHFHPFCLWMKKNSGKGLNSRPLGCKRDFNHCISFFSFENNARKKN
jgi:hypothetical protein